MPKNIDGVSLPERRKSIRDIPIPESRRRVPLDVVKRPVVKEPVSDESVLPNKPVINNFNGGGTGRSGRVKKLWFWVGGLVLVLLFALLAMFNGAEVTYTPKAQILTWGGESYSATKTAGSGLMYSVVKLSGDKSAVLEATGEQEVSRKASGTIVIYNNSTETQALRDTTRFQSNDGKIYRIAKNISVPAKSSAGPGSVEAVVYADQAGESYNIGLTDFTVPGLKGTPKFDLVYARSKTPMSNGFIGKEKVVDQASLAKAKTSLQAELSKELIAKAQAEVPADFILYPNLASVAYEDLPQSGASNASVTINLRGNLAGVMFKRSDLASTIATGKATISPKDQLEFETLESLNISFANGQSADILNLSKIDFKVVGSGTLFWKTDEVALKSALAGHKKSELSQIIKTYPTIVSATANIRPFWKTSFPADTSKIVIKKLKP